MKKNRIAFWVSTTIIFLWEGLMPLFTLLFAHQYFNAGTKPLGYPDYFAYALIACKVAGSAVIMLPKLPAALREWAYAGLTFNLLFATLSHMMVDKNAGFILMPVVVAFILAISYFTGRKIRQGNYQSVRISPMTAAT